MSSALLISSLVSLCAPPSDSTQPKYVTKGCKTNSSYHIIETKLELVICPKCWMYWRNNGCTQYDATWVLEGTMWNLSGVLSWNLLTFSAIDMNGEATARPTWTDSLLCNVCFSIQPLPQKLHYHKVCQSQVARRKEEPAQTYLERDAQ